MKKIFLGILVLVFLFAGSACQRTDKEQSFCDMYNEYAYSTIGSNEITDVVVYKDEIGGELAVINYNEKAEGSAAISKICYLVLQDITFKAEEITLEEWEVSLYQSAVNQHDGQKLSKGYFSVKIDVFNEKITKEYDLMLSWQSLQADIDYDTEYNIDKINEIINKSH